MLPHEDYHLIISSVGEVIAARMNREVIRAQFAARLRLAIKKGQAFHEVLVFSENR